MTRKVTRDPSIAAEGELLAVAREMHLALDRIASGRRPAADGRSLLTMTRKQMMALARSLARSVRFDAPTWSRHLRDCDYRAREILRQIADGALPDSRTVTNVENVRTPYADEGTVDALHANHLKSISLLLRRIETLEGDVRAANRTVSAVKREISRIKAGEAPVDDQELIELREFAANLEEALGAIGAVVFKTRRAGRR